MISQGAIKYINEPEVLKSWNPIQCLIQFYFGKTPLNSTRTPVQLKDKFNTSKPGMLSLSSFSKSLPLLTTWSLTYTLPVSSHAVWNLLEALNSVIEFVSFLFLSFRTPSLAEIPRLSFVSFFILYIVHRKEANISSLNSGYFASDYSEANYSVCLVGLL